MGERSAAALSLNRAEESLARGCSQWGHPRLQILLPRRSLVGVSSCGRGGGGGTADTGCTQVCILLFADAAIFASAHAIGSARPAESSARQRAQLQIVTTSKLPAHADSLQSQDWTKATVAHAMNNRLKLANRAAKAAAAPAAA